MAGTGTGGPRRDASPALTTEELLRSVPFFRDLDRVSLARLAGALEQVDLPAGKVVFREGTEAGGLYLLESGEVAVDVGSEGGDVEVATLAGPAHFGELGLLLARRTATVRSRTDARLWRLPKERFI
ncbi:MAG: cyclic nucleotide-binding domain-containing protein, partial [Candidatus Limnocylindria bacterium]